MKTLFSITTAALLVASTAIATPTVSLTLGPYQNGIGGEFTANPNAEALSPSGTPNLSSYLGYYVNGVTATANTFQTFCIEYTEHFSPGTAYQYAVSDRAISGGGGSVGGSDILSVGTAWLYLQFSSGVLGNYFGGIYTGNRNGAAGALQMAIWYLEDEVSLSAGDIAANIFLSEVSTQFGGSLANAKGDSYNGLVAADYGVGVLNLGNPNNRPAYPNQDQLIRIGAPRVPDGGMTLMLLAIAMFGLIAIRAKAPVLCPAKSRSFGRN